MKGGNPIRLETNIEIVGTLSKIKVEENQIKLKFSIMQDIELPKDAFSYQQLHDLVDKRIGILNLNGIYKIRQVKKQQKLRGVKKP